MLKANIMFKDDVLFEVEFDVSDVRSYTSLYSIPIQLPLYLQIAGISKRTLFNWIVDRMPEMNEYQLQQAFKSKGLDSSFESRLKVFNGSSAVDYHWLKFEDNEKYSTHSLKGIMDNSELLDDRAIYV